MEAFSDFAVIAGGAAAALLGLLFVAVSIRADPISRSAEVRTRIVEILTIFVTILIAWLCTALPNPSLPVLGAELIAVALGAGVTDVALHVRTDRSARRTAIGWVLGRSNPSVTTALLTGLGGVLLVLGLEAGLFVLAFATFIGIVGGVLGAWFVLVGPLRNAD